MSVRTFLSAFDHAKPSFGGIPFGKFLVVLHVTEGLTGADCGLAGLNIECLVAFLYISTPSNAFPASGSTADQSAQNRPAQCHVTGGLNPKQTLQDRVSPLKRRKAAGDLREGAESFSAPRNIGSKRVPWTGRWSSLYFEHLSVHLRFHEAGKSSFSLVLHRSAIPYRRGVVCGSPSVSHHRSNVDTEGRQRLHDVYPSKSSACIIPRSPQRLQELQRHDSRLR